MGEEEQPSSSEPERVTIPVVSFIEDVVKYLEGTTADDAIKQLGAHSQQYGLLEQQLMQKKARLIMKLPEIRRTLDALNLLIAKQEASEEAIFDFELASQVFAKARVREAASVNLWLGAGVMLEYPNGEAQELLEQNLKNCKENLANNAKDLELVKDLRTTTDVNIARIYNYDVQRRKSSMKEAGS